MIIGPAHAVYFGTYEIVKDLAGGNVDDGHHPLAAGRWFGSHACVCVSTTDNLGLIALSGASATIASDALMNPFDGRFFFCSSLTSLECLK